MENYLGAFGGLGSLRRRYFHHKDGGGGFSHHDVARHSTRWGVDADALKALAVLILTLRGSVCLYQGEELGLPEAEVDFDDLQDPYGIEFWPEYKGRDGCRTPMVWEPSNQNGGFSSGQPWLPVSPKHLQKSAQSQEDAADGMLNHYRRAIALRKEHAALRSGTHTDIKVTGSVLSFERRAGDETIFCAFNLDDAPAHLDGLGAGWSDLGADLGAVSRAGSNDIELGPWQFCLARKAG